MLQTVSVHSAQKYAINLTERDKETREFFMQNFGCARKVYNLLVGYLYDALEASDFVDGEIPKITFPEVTAFKSKDEYAYLKDADSLGLANARLDFTQAVNRYNTQFDHKSHTKRSEKRRKNKGIEPTFRDLKGMPKFHSRNEGYFSYKTNCQYPGESNTLKNPTVRLEDSTLILPKLKNGVKLIVHRAMPDNAVIGNVTISMDVDGQFFAAIEYTYEVEMDLRLQEAAQANDASILDGLKFLGLDYDQQCFYVDSEGETANHPHWFKESADRLTKLQHQLSRMERGSNNYKKKLQQIQKLQKHIRNQRLDFCHKLSTKLANEYDVIVVEDLDLRAMSQTLHLAKNLLNHGFGMFRDMLKYKLERKGSVLVVIDKWYPSSKTCSDCGYVYADLDLGQDEWVCPVCGRHHDRDENAAINIREEGKRIFLAFFREHLEEKAKADARAKNRSDKRKAPRKKASENEATA